MYIKKLLFKNIGSYGNDLQEINFSDKSNLNLISAKNGAGKTTILTTLTYALYGSVVGISNKYLVNRINKKKLYTEVHLYARNNDIIIKRGISPNIFIVNVNGNDITVAGKSNVNAMLERDIIGMPRHLFVNLVNISISNFTSFLQLKTKDKQKILDPFFNLTDINDLYTLIKDDIDMYNRDIEMVESTINMKERQIDRYNNNIDEINKKNIEQSKLLIRTYDAEIKELEQKLDSVNSKINIETSQLNKIGNVKSIIEKKISNSRTLLMTYKKRFKLLKGGVCDKCNSDLTTHTHTKELDDIKSDIQANVNILSDLTTKYDTVTKKYNMAEIELRNLTKNKSNIITDIKVTKSKKNSLSISSNNNYIATINESIEQLKIELSELEIKKVKLYRQLDIATKTQSYLTSDVGVKSNMIRSIVDPLNAILKQYTIKFNFNKFIEFDYNFDVQIYEYNTQINKSTLSDGEKTLVNLIIIFSFIAFLLMKHPRLNILFIDEIFRSLDIYNIPLCLDALRELSNQFNLNIFLIAHVDIEPQVFNNIIKVERSGNFSSVRTFKASEYINK